MAVKPNTQVKRHLLARIGNGFKLRSWDRQMVPDESGRWWLAYRLIDKTCGHTAVQVDRFDPNTDRRVIAFFIKSMRHGLKALVSEGPPS